MITTDKITEIFFTIDEFCKKFDEEIKKNPVSELPSADGKRRRNRKWQMSESEIMIITVCYHFGTFANFKPRRPCPTTASWISCRACSS